MNQQQAIFLANQFLNLDISYCDPDVWYTYMMAKRPCRSKYILALNSLLSVSSDDLHYFYTFIKEENIEYEVYDLIHAIPDDPTPLQYEIFHHIDGQYIE
jgi:hypothetical protein